MVAVGFVSAMALSGPDQIHWSVQSQSLSHSLAPNPTHIRPLPAGFSPLVPGSGSLTKSIFLVLSCLRAAVLGRGVEPHCQAARGHIVVTEQNKEYRRACRAPAVPGSNSTNRRQHRRTAAEHRKYSGALAPALRTQRAARVAAHSELLTRIYQKNSLTHVCRQRFS